MDDIFIFLKFAFLGGVVQLYVHFGFKVFLLKSNTFHLLYVEHRVEIDSLQLHIALFFVLLVLSQYWAALFKWWLKFAKLLAENRRLYQNSINLFCMKWRANLEVYIFVS